MKNNLSKIISAVIIAVSVGFISLHLSQDNEYKKLLKLNKKALASDGQVQFGEWELWGRCSYAIIECKYTCTKCKTDLTAGINGRSCDMSGNCPVCGKEPTNN